MTTFGAADAPGDPDEEMTWYAAPGYKIFLLVMYIPIGLAGLIILASEGDYISSVVVPAVLGAFTYWTAFRPRITVTGDTMKVVHWLGTTIIDRSNIHEFDLNSWGLEISRKTGKKVHCHYLAKGNIALLLKRRRYPDKVLDELEAWVFGAKAPDKGTANQDR